MFEIKICPGLKDGVVLAEGSDVAHSIPILLTSIFSVEIYVSLVNSDTSIFPEANVFANMDDEYMQARSADVKDISNRLVRNLSGEEQIDWSTMASS